MRNLFPHWLAVVAPLSVAACGGSAPPAEGPPSPTEVTPAGENAPDLDAGPTTTTTLTLADGGDLTGAKLASTTTLAADAGAPSSGSEPAGPHTPDPGRSPKDIQAIIVAHRDEARACYDAGQKAQPGIQGDLVVVWTIDPKGNVTNIALDGMRSQITEPTVVACVMDVIKKIKFAESPRGYETRATYPFNFKPHGAGKR